MRDNYTYADTPWGRLCFSRPFNSETGRMVMVHRAGGGKCGAWLLERFGGQDALTTSGKVAQGGIRTWIAYATAEKARTTQS